mgnify:FL=1
MNQPTHSWVKTVQLTQPTLSNNIADVDRLIDALMSDLNTNHIRIVLDLMRTLPALVRESE